MAAEKPAGAQAQARRRIYLRHRIPVLREEMQKLIHETQQTAEEIKGETGGPGTPEAKKVRERLIYLREYGHWLKSHLKELAQEKRALVASQPTPTASQSGSQGRSSKTSARKTAKR